MLSVSVLPLKVGGNYPMTVDACIVDWSSHSRSVMPEVARICPFVLGTYAKDLRLRREAVSQSVQIALIPPGERVTLTVVGDAPQLSDRNGIPTVPD